MGAEVEVADGITHATGCDIGWTGSEFVVLYRWTEDDGWSRNCSVAACDRASDQARQSTSGGTMP